MGKKKKGKQADNDDAPVEDAEAWGEDSDAERRMLPEVAELADRFGFPDDLAWRLHDVMDDRIDEYGNSLFREDIEMMKSKLDEAPQPILALVPLLKELSSGRFIAKAESHAEVVAFCRRNGLDRGASTKLTEAMHIRETKYGSNISQDLKILGAHLENSNAPSKLVSMKLKDIRAGYKLGNCVYARAKELQIAAEEGGPSIEGARSKKPPSGYSDRDLEQRFGATKGDAGGVTMTEEQARQFQRGMRKAEEKDKKKDEKKDKDDGSRKDDSSRNKGRSRSREKGRDKSRDKSREKGRDRGRDKSREKGRDKSSDRKKSRSRSRKSRSRSRRKKSRSKKNSRSRKR